MKKVSALKKEISDAAKDIPGCQIIPITATDVFLKDTRNALKNSSPKWVCTCRGKGCATCGQRGWLQEHCGVLFDEVSK